MHLLADEGTLLGVAAIIASFGTAAAAVLTATAQGRSTRRHVDRARDAVTTHGDAIVAEATKELGTIVDQQKQTNQAVAIISDQLASHYTRVESSYDIMARESRALTAYIEGLNTPRLKDPQ